MAAGRFPPARAARLLTAGARASARLPRRRRRVPLSRRAGARGREGRSSARARCASAQAREEAAAAAGRALRQSSRGRRPCRCAGGLQPWPQRSPAPAWKKKRERGLVVVTGLGTPAAARPLSSEGPGQPPRAPLGQLLAVSRPWGARLLGKASERGRPSHRRLNNDSRNPALPRIIRL